MHGQITVNACAQDGHRSAGGAAGNGDRPLDRVRPARAVRFLPHRPVPGTAFRAAGPVASAARPIRPHRRRFHTSLGNHVPGAVLSSHTTRPTHLSFRPLRSLRPW